MNLAARALIMKKILTTVLMTVTMMMMMTSTMRYCFQLVVHKRVPVDCVVPKSLVALYQDIV